MARQTAEVRPATSSRISGEAAELAPLVRLGAPLALASLGQTLIGTIAVAVAGRLGEDELSAVGLGAALYFTVAVFGLGVVLGIDPLITQALGRGDHEGARRGLSQGIWLALAAALGLALVIAALAVGLDVLGLPADTARFARGYLFGRLPGLAPYLVFAALRSFAAAEGETRPVLMAAVVANLSMFIVAPLLAQGSVVLGLGPARTFGIGLAESAGACLQLAVLFASPLGRKLRRLRLATPSRELGLEVLRVGIPVGLALVAEHAVFATVNLLVALIEPAALGAHQVAITWVGTLFMLPVGLGGATVVRVGRALGRGDVLAARRAGRASLVLSLLFGIGAAALFWLFPWQLSGLISRDPRVLAVSAPLMGIAALALAADSVQAALAGAVRGAGDTRFALWATLLSHYGLGLPLGVALSTRGALGASGLWLGLTLGLGAVAIALAVRFSRTVSLGLMHGKSWASHSRKRSSLAPWPAPRCSPPCRLDVVPSRLPP